MKRNKGLTIPELLATIVITGILMLVATASYNGISKTIKTSILESKLKLIKTKAVEYAIDYNLQDTTITVAKLISEGYLDMENNVSTNEKIENPLGGYLDCYRINITKNTAEYTADVYENDDCSLSDFDSESAKVNVYVYADSDDLEAHYLGKNSDVSWTNKNVYLYLDLSKLSSSLLKSEMTITWKDNFTIDTKKGNITNKVTNNTNYANIYKVSTTSLINTIVTVYIETDIGTISKEVSVLIDKEKPTLDLIANDSYDKSSKNIIFDGSDGDGSGLADYAYYITTDSNKVPTEDEFNISSSLNSISIDENANYYGYAIDKVGNISEAYNISVTNIDNDMPVCLIPENNPTWSKEYTYTYGCKEDAGTGCKSGDKYTKTVTEEKEYENISWEVEDNIGNKKTCVANVAVNIDKTPPTCEITVTSGTLGKNNWYTSDVYLTMTSSDNVSGVTEYGITTSRSVTYNNKSTASLTTDTGESGITYYGYVKDKAGNEGTCSLTVKRLTSRPTCTVSLSGTKGYNNWYRSSVTAYVSSSSTGVTSKKITYGSYTYSNSYTIYNDTSGSYVYGTVENAAGLTGSCSSYVKIDKTAPTIRVRMLETCSPIRVEFCTAKAWYGCKSSAYYTVSCDTWDDYGLSNSSKLLSYTKSRYSNYNVLYISNNPSKKATVSTTTAEIYCKDYGSGLYSYSLGGRRSSTYNVANDSSFKSNHGGTLSGSCVDYAGNTSYASASVKEKTSTSSSSGGDGTWYRISCSDYKETSYEKADYDYCWNMFGPVCGCDDDSTSDCQWKSANDNEMPYGFNCWDKHQKDGTIETFEDGGGGGTSTSYTGEFYIE